MGNYLDVQNAIDYIEKNIKNDIDITSVAKFVFLGKQCLQKLFYSFCGETIASYIRKRRLSIASKSIITSKSSITDIAFEYGYGSPESFSRAIFEFNGASPMQIRSGKVSAKYYNKIQLKIMTDGGNMVNYKIVEMESLKLTGLKTKMQGDFSARLEQEHEFCSSVENMQELLFAASVNKRLKQVYGVVNNFARDGFDFYLAYDCGGKVLENCELIDVPKSKYLMFVTEKSKKPMSECNQIIQTINSEWLQENNFELDYSGSIIEKIFWYLPNSADRENRYVEYYIPIL